MGRSLKKVFRGAMTVEESVALATKEIKAVFDDAAVEEEKTGFGYAGDEVGICPLCGAAVRRTSFGYGCSAYREGCKFSIRLKILGKLIPLSVARKLLTDGKTETLDGFISQKTGKTFSAALKLEEGNVTFEFAPRKTAAAEEPPPPQFY